MSGFHEVSFPMRLALGAVGGPERRTDIITLASGKEIRNARWAGSRRRWDVGSAISNLTDLQILLGFFEARQGRLFGFRFRDPMDFSSAPPGQAVSPDDQVLGIGDGSTSVFQLVKEYSGTERRISKPINGTVRVALDGAEQNSGWSFNSASGEIRFDAAPVADSLVTAGFEFECPVRFENDQINGVIEAFGVGRVASVSLIELL